MSTTVPASRPFSSSILLFSSPGTHSATTLKVRSFSSAPMFSPIANICACPVSLIQSAWSFDDHSMISPPFSKTSTATGRSPTGSSSCPSISIPLRAISTLSKTVLVGRCFPSSSTTPAPSISVCLSCSRTFASTLSCSSDSPPSTPATAMAAYESVCKHDVPRAAPAWKPSASCLSVPQAVSSALSLSSADVAIV